MRRPLLTFSFLAVLSLLALGDPASARGAWAWPVHGEVITPYRNGADPYATGQHRGIDIGAPVGAAVVAAASGEVRFAGTAGSSGVTVSIRTSDGLDTSYLHLSALAVRAGARVSAGDRIGAVGATGARSVQQPHLHFGVRDAGTRHAYHDPMRFLPPPPAPPRAPDPPPPAAAPEPAPAPPAAAPAPVRVPDAAPRRAPVRRREPVRRRAPRQVPVGRRARRPAPTAHRAPLPAPLLRRAPQPAPAGEPAPPGHPAPATRPATEARHAANRARGVEDSPRPASGPRRAPPRATSTGGRGALARAAHRTTGVARPAGSAGAHLGWALACAGLLLAAGLLGLSESGRRSSRRGRGRLTETLRPLLGRR